MNRPEINIMFSIPSGCCHERQMRESLSEIKNHGADSVYASFLEDT